ncbi:DUF4229 domain-containing protein [Brachybacterium fresconis]|uniref:DUF4229 domain-containing protein n=1 Tax=Brachybacterium fresconis TaxID=173363 RepID=A0ABS4YIH1_9MICO|nr:DUF4229 domain-containing protein [Brachybacterium fresconis]MBP2408603.1 hypothetical protein [Brachybacterium fresconis]
MRDMALFAVIRLLLWVGIWWLLTLFDVGLLLAAALAALIAMLISILFLDRLRSSAALRWKAADERRRARKGRPVDHDADAEDAALDEDGTHDEVHDGPDEDDADEDDADQERPGAGPAVLPDLAHEAGEVDDASAGGEQDAAGDPAPDTVGEPEPGTESRRRRS